MLFTETFFPDGTFDEQKGDPFPVDDQPHPDRDDGMEKGYRHQVGPEEMAEELRKICASTTSGVLRLSLYFFVPHPFQRPYPSIPFPSCHDSHAVWALIQVSHP